ncbi:MAG: hypothetical protein C4547_05490 [Phycisphaerales bacterium]|nr:MAG: hypothetical protein C4547_05490 [Phycisphaerales bacterium]
MKWIIFVVLTIVCWGAYVPVLHQGQSLLSRDGPAPLRAFMFVGLAYFLVSGLVLLYLAASRAEPLLVTAGGGAVSTAAGILGAVGALGVVFALKFGKPTLGVRAPLLIPPLVFAGAPIVNTVVSMLWHRPTKAPSLWFYLGIVMAAAGAALVLRFKPT